MIVIAGAVVRCCEKVSRLVLFLPSPPLFFFFFSSLLFTLQLSPFRQSSSYVLGADRTGDTRICVNHNTSCSYQIGSANASEDSCQVIFHTNRSQVCGESMMRGSAERGLELSKFSLSVYLYVKNKVRVAPAFNISFSDIVWKRVVWRFRENLEKPTICREMVVDPYDNPSFTLFFDCLWKKDYDGKTYQFEYQALSADDTIYKYRYIFVVPQTSCIDPERTKVSSWETFMYVDLSLAPDTIILHLQVAPRSLNITSYRVELLKTLEDSNNSTWVVLSKTLTPGPDETELVLPYHTRSKSGIYYFTSYPIHKDCRRPHHCLISKTPEFLIVDMTQREVLIAIVSTVILIPVLITAYLIWRRKCYNPVPSNEAIGPPKILLMYSPVSVEHVRKMMELTKYFSEVCHLRAMLDQFGIPQSELRDPLRWYSDAFSEAKFVAIFASPSCTPEQKEEVLQYNRYLNTEVIAQNQLRHRLCSPGATCQFFCVGIPGTDWDTLPPEAQALKRYTLPRDLDPMLFMIGVSPQCDHGVGFNDALRKAQITEPSLELTPAITRAALPPILKETVPVEASVPPPPEDLGTNQESSEGPTQEAQWDAQSLSSIDLVSSRPCLSGDNTSVASSTSNDDPFLGPES